jgi:MFS family permease
MKPRRLAPFVLLEVSSVFEAIAGGMTYIIVPWLILDLTGSPLIAGLVTASKGVIAFVIFPLAGTFVDRIGRRRVAITSDILAAVTAMAFPLVTAAFGPSVGVAIVVTVLGAMFEPPGFTARKSLVANTAEASNMTLERANGIHESIRGLGLIGGPAVGALALAAIGPQNAYWVVGIGFTLSFLAVSFVRISHVVGGESDVDVPRQSFFRDTIDGIRVLFRDRALFVLITFWVVLDMVYLPSEEIVLPVYFEGKGDPLGLGIIVSAMLLGVVVGSLFFEFLARRWSLPVIIRVSVLTCCTVMLTMALFPPVWLFAIIGFAMGLSWGPMNPVLSLLIQRRFPASIQGRVFGVQLAIFSAAPAIALPFVGALVEAFGAQPVYFVLVVSTFVLALAVVFLPVLNDFGRSSTVPMKVKPMKVKPR